MRETDFIGQNKEKWADYERVLNSGSADAERLSRLFVETTDDLSFARTYYPNRSVRVYINGIAQYVYHKVYRNRKREKGAFKNYWKAELPDAVWHARKTLLASFLIFLLGMGIGLLSSAHDPSFVNLILGDGYVQMTEENIAKGNPLGVYDQGGMLETFLYITWNNIRVGVLCFLLGLLFQAGSVFIVLSNAVMVGAFFWFFIERKLFGEMFYAVMLHGTLELSMIVLAGAAGMTLGRGLVQPGSYTRLQALLISARQGIRIMLGVSAFLVVAGFIEGFATRFTNAPNFIRGLVVLLSAALIVGYFVVYPYRRYKRGLTALPTEEETFASIDDDGNVAGIRSTGEIVNSGWRNYLPKANAHVIASVVGGAFITLFYIVSTPLELLGTLDTRGYSSGDIIDSFFDGFWFWDEAEPFFRGGDNVLVFFPLYIVFGSLLWWSSRAFLRRKDPDFRPTLRRKFRILANSFVAAFFLLLPIFFNDGDEESILLMAVIFGISWPFFLLQLATAQRENHVFMVALVRTFDLFRKGGMRVIGAFYAQLLVLMAGMSIVSAPILYLVYDIIGSNIKSDYYWSFAIPAIIYIFVLHSAIGALVQVLIHTIFSAQGTAAEICDASELMAEIERIELKSKAYGLEKDS